MSPVRTSYVGRFAPSPTGDLHFGSLLVAVGSWLRARSRAGEWLLRIEDLDRTRSDPDAPGRILSTLANHALLSDRPVVYQHADTARFAAALDRLVSGGAAYPCHCSRAVVDASGGIHRSCVTASGIADDRPPGWRFRVPSGEVSWVDSLRGAQSQDVRRDVGDFVLRRANGEFTYHLAVVVDDAAQGVTEVVRGGDLVDSTARQILLQRALGVPTPGYLHLPLAVDDAGAKLSKQARSAPVDPHAPLTTLRVVLAALGQRADPSARSPGELLESAAARFDFAALPRAPRLPEPRY